jgi:hypothetical protein
MNQRRVYHEAVLLLEEKSGTKVSSQATGKDHVEVTLLMGAQRSPLTFNVPQGCNMKILKSIIWFNLKKVLTLT